MKRGAYKKLVTVNCSRCGWPLPFERAWKKREGNKLLFFCDEHVVVDVDTHTFRPLQPGDTPPKLQVGEGIPDIERPTPAEPEYAPEAEAAVLEPPPVDPLSSDDLGF